MAGQPALGAIVAGAVDLHALGLPHCATAYAPGAAMRRLAAAKLALLESATHGATKAFGTAQRMVDGVAATASLHGATSVVDAHIMMTAPSMGGGSGGDEADGVAAACVLANSSLYIANSWFVGCTELVVHGGRPKPVLAPSAGFTHIDILAIGAKPPQSNFYTYSFGNSLTCFLRLRASTLKRTPQSIRIKERAITKTKPDENSSWIKVNNRPYTKLMTMNNENIRFVFLKNLEGICPLA